jgi:hypothetical protein
MKILSHDQTDLLAKYIDRVLIHQFHLDPNITSIGISKRILERQGGLETDEVVICFTVKVKKPEHDLVGSNKMIARKMRVYGGFEIGSDVVTRSFDFSLKKDFEDHGQSLINERHPILRPGISVGNVFRSRTGTISAIVFKNNKAHILSNYHILGNVDTLVCQPGAKDILNTMPNAVGRVKEVNEEYDCAIALIESVDQNTPARTHDLRVIGLNGIEIKGHASAELNQKVVKYGRGTSDTHGIVKTIRAVIRSEGEIVKGQFIVKVDPMLRPQNCQLSSSMDSGSPWLKKGEQGRPTSSIVGITVGGNIDSENNCNTEYCFGTESQFIVDSLKISFS